jgi:ADP-heptose:LPS heptosyltransferase
MILISPYSRPLRNGKNNPKNFPYWREVVDLLKTKNDIVQIGVEGEKKLCQDFRKGLPLDEVKKLIKECDIWVSVDNFLQHLAHHILKPGVVIWGVSDPNIFGYPENVNMLKGHMYLREKQFDMYEDFPFNANVFVTAKEVVEEVNKLLSRL